MPDTEVETGLHWLCDRRVQLATAVVVMACIAPLQYAWTLFTTSLSIENGWTLAGVQLAFTFFVVLQTAVQPGGGYLMDKRGPALVYGLASLAIVVGWGGLGIAHRLVVVYALYALAGVGVGLAYSGAIATAIRWFPERRGLALGMVAAAFGAGAAPFIPLIQFLIDDKGYPVAFAATGILAAVVVAVAGLLLRHPSHSRCVRPAGHAMPAAASHDGGLHPWDLLSLGQFWVAFLAFFFMATGLLILTANTKPLALDLGLATSVVVVAVTLQQVMNGVSRLAWGWVSDHVGRRLTMVVAFSLNGLFLYLIPIFGESAIAFVVLTSLAFFTAGGDLRAVPRADSGPFRDPIRRGQPGHALLRKGDGGADRGQLRRMACDDVELAAGVRSRRDLGVRVSRDDARASPKIDGAARQRG